MIVTALFVTTMVLAIILIWAGPGFFEDASPEDWGRDAEALWNTNTTDANEDASRP